MPLPLSFTIMPSDVACVESAAAVELIMPLLPFHWPPLRPCLICAVIADSALGGAIRSLFVRSKSPELISVLT